MTRRSVGLFVLLSAAAIACGGNGSGSEQPEVNAASAAVPTLKELEPFTYCAIEAQGSWSQHEEMKARLAAAVAEQNIPIQGEVLGVWYSYPEETAEEDRIWEVGYRVEASVVVSEPLVIKRWETRHVYSQVYDGPAGESGPFFEAYWVWFAEKNLRVIRPLLEIDLPQPETYRPGIAVPKFEALIEAEPVNH